MWISLAFAYASNDDINEGKRAQFQDALEKKLSEDKGMSPERRRLIYGKLAQEAFQLREYDLALNYQQAYLAIDAKVDPSITATVHMDRLTTLHVLVNEKKTKNDVLWQAIEEANAFFQKHQSLLTKHRQGQISFLSYTYGVATDHKAMEKMKKDFSHMPQYVQLALERDMEKHVLAREYDLALKLLNHQHLEKASPEMAVTYDLLKGLTNPKDQSELWCLKHYAKHDMRSDYLAMLCGWLSDFKQGKPLTAEMSAEFELKQQSQDPRRHYLSTAVKDLKK